MTGSPATSSSAGATTSAPTWTGHPVPRRTCQTRTAVPARPAYRELFADVLSWARETIADESGGRHRQRVRWWASGSPAQPRVLPAAAAATLRNRAAPAPPRPPRKPTRSAAQRPRPRRRRDAGRPDATPGADARPRGRRRDTAGGCARRPRADQLTGPHDAKLAHTAKLVAPSWPTATTRSSSAGSSPRPTTSPNTSARPSAESRVESVTGVLPPAEREARIKRISASSATRVLVATDCLSEGINLQEYFDAVVHYDLPWNPTRLEQREGRVDRYGQPSPTVKVATVYGTDNVIDEIVLDVLLRKHKKIRSELGISIPVPGSNDEFIESVFERIFTPENRQLSLFEEPVRAVQQSLFEEWDRAAEKEQRSRRTRYAQHTISTAEVEAEVAAVRAAIGSADDVARFVRTAITALGGAVSGDGTRPSRRPSAPHPVRPAWTSARPARHGRRAHWSASSSQPSGQARPTCPAPTRSSRPSPATCLTPPSICTRQVPAARCGAIRTTAVTTATTVLLTRYRFEINAGRQGGHDEQLLAEDLGLAAFQGPPASATWLPGADAGRLLTAIPDSNIPPEQRSGFVRRVVDGAGLIIPALERQAAERAAELATAHRRVRRDAGAVVTGQRQGSSASRRPRRLPLPARLTWQPAARSPRSPLKAVSFPPTCSAC